MIELQNGWRIQSSALVPADGAASSTADHDGSLWRRASVPGTILAALVDDGIHTNIFPGTNPLTMPTAPFNNSRWFRAAFDLNREEVSGFTFLYHSMSQPRDWVPVSFKF